MLTATLFLPGRVWGLTTNAVGLIAYTAFDGKSYTLRPWLGRNVAVLTPTGRTYNTNVMVKILVALDKAYDFYEAATARRPGTLFGTVFEGRDTIAIVNTTCGAGCSEVGSTGTEVVDQFFQVLYNAVASAGQYDQLLFYELGRTFWFYSPQLAYSAPDVDPVVTGYAVYMRFQSMQAIGVPGAPFNGNSFKSFAMSETNLLDAYVRSSSLNWSNTFRVNKAPANSLGLGGTDLIASLLMHIARDFGGPRFVLDFWKQAEFRPVAQTTQVAADNFVLTACAATGQNLTQVFATHWKWPVTDAAFAEARLRWGEPTTFHPHLAATNQPGQGIQVSWQSQVNSHYQPQGSPDLEHWSNVGDPILGNGSVLSVQADSTLAPFRFFRIQIL